MPCRNSDLCLSVNHSSPFRLNASIDCSAGELLALVGPSGSGKSTLLRMIAGLAEPSEGRIACGGRIWFDSASGVSLAPQQRHVGFMPQHYGLFPHMTAMENVKAGLGHIERSGRDRLAADWLARVRLAGLEKRKPSELSGGQQQRVALARALARGPSVLLLDEPFAAVDRATRETLYIELAELKRGLSLPIIMVTHDINEALLLADRMTLLSHGRTIQSDPPRKVLARPVDEAAARLLGIRNLFDGTIESHDEADGLTWISFGDCLLASPLETRWSPGSRVRWMVPNSGVRLRGGTQGGLPASRNRVRITVMQILPLGDDVRITASFSGQDMPLHLQVAARLAEKLELQPGSFTDVVFQEESIHILQIAA